MVELQQVTVSFRPRFALQSLSLRVPQGGSLALWGPNGAGKSTTFHAILDLVPYAGKITIGGRDAQRDGVAARRLIGWAPQDLPPADLSVAGTLNFTARLRGVAASPESLALFGLEGSASTPVAALSGGQRKRLSLLLALVGDPPVLLLDEPTAGLDPAGRREILQLLSGLRRQGKTLILASHRLGDVLRLADQVALLEEGRLTRLIPASHMVRRLGGGTLRRRGAGERSCACD